MSVGSKFIEEMTFIERAKYDSKHGIAPGDNSNLARVVQTWTVERVCGILTAMGMTEYIPLFHRHKIDGIRFLSLDPNGMVALGLSHYNAMKLYNTVANTIAGTTVRSGGSNRGKHYGSSSGYSKVTYEQHMAAAARAAAAAAAGMYDSYNGGVDGFNTFSGQTLPELPNVIEVDLCEGTWPDQTADRRVGTRVAVTGDLHEMRVEAAKPAMVLVFKGGGTPLYTPDASSALDLCLPAGCPLPLLRAHY